MRGIREATMSRPANWDNSRWGVQHGRWWRSGALQRERQPVSDRNQARRHPLVVMNLLVQGAEGIGIVVPVGRVGYPPAPEGVIEPQQAARANELQRQLVVAVVVALVGVDEGEVERARFAAVD